MDTRGEGHDLQPNPAGEVASGAGMMAMRLTARNGAVVVISHQFGTRRLQPILSAMASLVLQRVTVPAASDRLPSPESPVGSLEEAGLIRPRRSSGADPLRRTFRRFSIAAHPAARRELLRHWICAVPRPVRPLPGQLRIQISRPFRRLGARAAESVPAGLRGQGLGLSRTDLRPAMSKHAGTVSAPARGSCCAVGIALKMPASVEAETRG